MKRLGIYSGTFDPVHAGHIAFAVAAMRVCGLDEVVFIPEQRPRGKQQITDIAHRVALLERAIADTPGLHVATLQSERFTVAQTLPEIQALANGAELTLLLGSDVVRTFTHQWESLRTLLSSVSLAIGMRVHDDPGEIANIIHDIEQSEELTVHYTCITTPHAHIASSQFRQGSGVQIDMHPAIRSYVLEHNLYQGN